jgi:hypothetical protein
VTERRPAWREREVCLVIERRLASRELEARRVIERRLGRAPGAAVLDGWPASRGLLQDHRAAGVFPL